MSHRTRPALLLIVLLSTAWLPELAAPASAAFPTGDGQQTADLEGVPIQVFTYRPDGCALSGILLVFHGLDRNAGDYRHYARPLGQLLCRVVVAPLFDKERFPTWRYQRGGIVHDGRTLPEADWTVNLVPRLVAWVRQQQGTTDLPYALMGHSAGGQFLSRVAAFASVDGARQIVIANPSTWVEASLEVAAPYGFGGVYPAGQGAGLLKRYLAEPVTVLLGQEDVKSKNLATSDEAEEQGPTRIARGENVYHAAEQTAHQHGWAFNWHLAVVPGVGHNASEMFNSEQAVGALQ